MSGCRWIAGLSACMVLASTVAQAAAEPGPREMIQQVTDELLAEIHRDPDQLRDVSAVRALTERYILPHIDFRAASQWVLGKHWRMASPQQRNDFEREFRTLLLHTYLRAISNYQDNRITIMPAHGELERGRAEVDAEIGRPDGPPVHLSFRLHHAGAEWLVFDIVVEGVSLVTTHRSTFSREITEQGLDNLIRRLAVQNAGGDSAAASVDLAPAQCVTC